MKTFKIFVIILIVLLATMTIVFKTSTSFVDGLRIDVPEKTDFIHPSKLLVKYEAFISGTVLRPVYRNFIERLNLTGNEKILDFGSGSGGEAIHVAEKIRDKNGSLTCLDISHTWLEVVKYRLSNYKNIDYIEGDIVKKNIPENSYDVIILRLVLHDIPADIRKPIIATFHKILKPGGALYILEPLGTGHAIDENEMRSLFKNAGFKERYFKKYYSLVMVLPHAMGEAAYDK
jgi:ubiquinone/menaquinone biosynthesis C-methylase UbiE